RRLFVVLFPRDESISALPRADNARAPLRAAPHAGGGASMRLNRGRYSVIRLQALILCLLSTGLASAQTVVVKHNVNLRKDPSTQNPRIELLTPGTSLQLLSPTQTNGYYNVSTTDGTTGFVYARNVQVVAGGTTSTGGTTTTGGTSTSSGAP